MLWKLFLDDERYPVDNTWYIARNVDDAIWYVTNYGTPIFISFDHDLGSHKATGMDFARWFCNHIMDMNKGLPDGFNFYVHSQNPVGAKNIQLYMDQFIGDWC
jgi:hypothetical protein